MVFYKLTEGANFCDERGGLNFFTGFDLSEISRMYEILPSDTNTIRGWQGHKAEKKWFYCNSGSFIVHLIEVDNFDLPSKALKAKRFLLEASKPSVLEISGGYATAFKAKEVNSKLIVFSNFSLEASKNDDFRFHINTWSADW
jgi:dTDP-4-dehydrorhamnose 3,5-epimerase